MNKWKAENPERVRELNRKSNAKWKPIEKALREAGRLAKLAYLAEHAVELEAAVVVEKERARVARNAYRAKWRKDNPEKRRAAKSAQERRAAERRAAKKAVYLAANPHIAIAAAAERAIKIKARKKVKRHTRRARERGAPGRLSKGLEARLLVLQKGKCPVCRDALTDRHLDHIIPLAGGGDNTDRNIQLLCPACNFSKHAKHPVEFMQERGFLL